MEVMLLLDALEDILDKANTIPLSSKVLVNKEELLELVKDIRIKIPDEVKQAQWIKEERQKILMEAKKEAEGVRTECEDKLSRIKEERQRMLAEAEKEAEIMRQEADKRLSTLIEESEIVKRANEQAKEIILAAQQDAKKIRLGSRAYADDILAELEKYTNNISSTIKVNREELKNKKS
ncbi:MAG: glycyl-tRNA synthetase beta chain [Clostridia bacterium]|jgi:cell division septum initiation protein DivIVA|nr:glycyl-tRNA synthetase beta chain [Clostridia bacterium]MDF2892948.1 glycyl-tRNA synthetase beta chain [Clostridia bacterium]